MAGHGMALAAFSSPAKRASSDCGTATPVGCSSPGTPGFASSGSGSKAINRICVHCEDEVPASQCCLWGNKAWTCHPCKSNYNRQTERVKGCASLTRWWRGLTKPQKVYWYKTNKATYQPHGRTAFDNAGYYEEEEKEVSLQSEDSLYKYLPLEEWFIREKLLGRVGTGSDESQWAAAEASFLARILDTKAKKKKQHGVWCIGVFKGCEDRVAQQSVQEKPLAGSGPSTTRWTTTPRRSLLKRRGLP